MREKIINGVELLIAFEAHFVFYVSVLLFIPSVLFQERKCIKSENRGKRRTLKNQEPELYKRPLIIVLLQFHN